MYDWAFKGMNHISVHAFFAIVKTPINRKDCYFDDWHSAQTPCSWNLSHLNWRHVSRCIGNAQEYISHRRQGGSQAHLHCIDQLPFRSLMSAHKQFYSPSARNHILHHADIVDRKMHKIYNMPIFFTETNAWAS
jgi:hypothetical protein